MSPRHDSGVRIKPPEPKALGQYARSGWFILFSGILALLAYFWHEIVQSAQDPLFPAFPRWLGIVLPLAGWLTLLFTFPTRSFKVELPTILRIAMPAGLGLGAATLMIVDVHPVLLVLPILLPAIVTSLYATTFFSEQDPNRVTSGALFFVVFGLFYLLAYSAVIVLPLATPPRQIFG